ncbi:MAG: DUF4838 domain-containing protein [Lentisphaeria bacterium]|nr:DUF4838 domain-containing protein [Lentisphaeria bacterium]
MNNNKFHRRYSDGSHNVQPVFNANGILFETHPDYFPLIKGKRKDCNWNTYYNTNRKKNKVHGFSWQPCLSNPDVQKMFIDTARKNFDGGFAGTEFFGGRKDAVDFSLHFNDGQGNCECKNCVKMNVKGTPVRFGRQLTFAKIIARETYKTHPNKILWLTCYGNAIPPEEALKDLPPNLYFTVCSDRAQYRDAKFRAKDEADLKRLLTYAKGVGLYEYFYGYGFVIPRIYSRLLASSFKKAHKMGAMAVTGEAYCNWSLDGPKLWVASKLMWNPNLDVGKLTDEFCTIMFEEAADPMRKHFELSESNWEKQKGKGRCQFKWWQDMTQLQLMSLKVMKTSEAYIDKALSMDVSDEVKERIRFYRDGFKTTSNFISMYHPAAKKSNIDAIIKDMDDKLKLRDPAIKFAQTLLKDPLYFHVWSGGPLKTHQTLQIHRVDFALSHGMLKNAKLLSRKVTELKGAKNTLEHSLAAIKKYMAAHPDAKALQRILDKPNEFFPQQMTAIRTKKTMRVDGKDNESAWKKIPAQGDFELSRINTMIKPNNIHKDKATPNSATTFRITFDKTKLYIFVSSEIKKNQLKMKQRKEDNYNIISDDLIQIKFDANSTGKEFLSMQLNALGNSRTTKNGDANKWNPVFDCKSIVTDDTWKLEIAIPFEEMGVIGVDGAFEGGKSWRFNIGRKAVRDRQASAWVRVPHTEKFGNADNCGVIYFEKAK